MNPRPALANACTRAAIPGVDRNCSCGVAVVVALAFLALAATAFASPANPPNSTEPSATAAVASEPDDPLPVPAPVTAVTARTSTKVVGPAIGPPPLALAVRWTAISARDSGPNLRKELVPIVTLAAKGRAAEACAQATSLLEARLQEAAKLFYAPVRKDANVAAIERFLDRWVRGNDPVLVIAGEVLAPAPSWRDAAAVACLRAGRFADAERVLRPAAFLADAGPQRATMVLLRWLRTRDLRPHAWMLEAAGAGVEAQLLRWMLEPAASRAADLVAMRQRADAKQRELIDAVEAWSRSPR